MDKSTKYFIWAYSSEVFGHFTQYTGIMLGLWAIASSSVQLMKHENDANQLTKQITITLLSSAVSYATGKYLCRSAKGLYNQANIQAGIEEREEKNKSLENVIKNERCAPQAPSSAP
jgi:hypothetical protein